MTGYHQLAAFITRKGKSRLSLQKVVASFQSKFSSTDWYFLRKIHKKESNFFLNIGGQKGQTGPGWLSRPSKSSKNK